jgi:hypothetical protein
LGQANPNHPYLQGCLGKVHPLPSLDQFTFGAASKSLKHSAFFQYERSSYPVRP